MAYTRRRSLRTTNPVSRPAAHETMSTCNLSLSLTHLIFFCCLCLYVGSGVSSEKILSVFCMIFKNVVCFFFFFFSSNCILCVWWLFPWQRFQSRSFIFSSWCSSSLFFSLSFLVSVVLDISDGASAAKRFSGAGRWGANVRRRMNRSLPRGATSTALGRWRSCRCRVLRRRRRIQPTHQTDATGAS